MRPRVTHVLPSLTTGGAEMTASHIMRSIDATRWDVHAVSLFPAHGGMLEESLRAAGVPIHFLGKRRGLDLRMYAALDALFARLRPQVVHTHQYVLRYVLPSLIRYRVPARVHTVHTLAQRELSRPLRPVHHLAFGLGVVPVAIASEVAESVRRLYGRPPRVIPNGIPIERFAAAKSHRARWRSGHGYSAADLLVVCVARLSREKNHALLLQVFSGLLEQNRRCHLLLVGDGPMRASLIAEIAKLGVEQSVHLLGDRADVPDILAASDVFALASMYEGNPLSVMEAMAAGLPVVCTAVGGVPELVEHGRSGLLVLPNDEPALQGALATVLRDAEARAAYGRTAAALARDRFGAALMALRYEALYAELLGARWTESQPRHATAAGVS